MFEIGDRVRVVAKDLVEGYEGRTGTVVEDVNRIAVPWWPVVAVLDGDEPGDIGLYSESELEKIDD